MCGIYGSFNLSQFEVLEQANRQRGNFSAGLLYIHNKNNYQILKTQYNINWESDKFKNIPSSNDNSYLYLGHNQAPTSINRDWDDITTHPFVIGEWAVAHNGVLSNFKSLRDKYVSSLDVDVDTIIIPSLLNKFQDNKILTKDEEIKNIQCVLDLLQGTFSVWIVNLTSLNVYLARQGSNLFYNKSNFSSIKGNNYKELKEGYIYEINKNRLVKKLHFTNDTPFLNI